MNIGICLSTSPALSYQHVIVNTHVNVRTKWGRYCAIPLHRHWPMHVPALSLPASATRNADVFETAGTYAPHQTTLLSSLTTTPTGPQNLTMRTILALTTLFACLISSVYATALTYRLEAHEKACFFAQVEHKGTKLAFYFAVQSGGSFDVDYSVVGPTDKVILDGTKERQGDFVFTANDVGEYRFCFNNEMSTFAEKMVDFEIAVSHLYHLHLRIEVVDRGQC
jgi:hypothetical protein